MPGELRGGAVHAVRAERLGVRRVQPHSFAGQQVVVDRLGQERVPEGVAVGADPDQDVLLDGGAQGSLEHVLGLADDGGEQRVAHPTARAGGGPHDGACVVLEAVEPHQQQVGEVVGQAGAVRALAGADELLGEERVALGTADDRVQVALGQRAGQERSDEAAHVPVRQRVDLDAVHARDPDPLGGGRAQRVTAVEVVGAVGREHDDGPAEGAGEEEGEQVTGRAVGPVHVLDHDEHRPLLGEVVERAVDRVEEVGALEVLGGLGGGSGDQPAARLEVREHRTVAGQLGDHLGPVAREPAEQLGEGEIGQRAVAEVQAVPDQRLPAGRPGAGHELAQQPGLADPRVADQQHGARPRLSRQAE